MPIITTNFLKWPESFVKAFSVGCEDGNKYPSGNVSLQASGQQLE